MITPVSPLRTKAAEPVLEFQTPSSVPGIYIFWLQLQNNLVRKIRKNIVRKINMIRKIRKNITQLLHKLYLRNRNPNFKLRLNHLKVFASDSSHPKLLRLRDANQQPCCVL